MRNLLKMLPLAELAHGVEASLPVELVVEGFIEGCTDTGRYVSFYVGQKSPPTVSAFHSEGIIVQTGTGCPHRGEHPVGHCHEGVVGVVHRDLRGVAVFILT